MDDYETTGATLQKLNASSGQNIAAKFSREVRWQTLTESGSTLGFSAVPTCPCLLTMSSVFMRTSQSALLLLFVVSCQLCLPTNTPAKGPSVCTSLSHGVVAWFITNRCETRRAGGGTRCCSWNSDSFYFMTDCKKSSLAVKTMQLCWPKSLFLGGGGKIPLCLKKRA